jgi:phosphoglycerol transferase
MGKKKRNKSGQAIGSGAVAAEFKQASTPRTQGYSVGQISRPNFFTGNVFEWLAVTATSLLAFWFLTARLVGVDVSVLIDEYSYVLDAHYRGLSEAFYPNHLFQLFYSTTKACGADFYSCSRSLNAVFVVAGAIFVYLLAKEVSRKKWLGALSAVAAVLGSYGTYTAYFMPEAIFNFAMIVFFWSLLRYGKVENLLAWAGFGVILGIASLAKPHAIFVVPAVVFFVFLWTRSTKGKFLTRAVLRIGAFVIALFVTKFGLGYLLAGQKALGVFGSYGTLESASGNAASTFARNAGLDVLATSWGQILMITMVIGVALPVSVLALLQSFKLDSESFEAMRVRILIGLSLLNMMAVTAVFEAWQYLFTWMHTRYYSYLIPLAIVVLVEAYSRNPISSNQILKRVVVGTFLIFASVALFTAAIPYGANWIDAPDFRFHIDNIVLSSTLIVISFGLAIWWLFDNKKPMLFALMIGLISSTMSGIYISNFLVASFGQDSTYDQLGRVLRNYLPQAELDKTVLIGDNNTSMERALFGSLSGGAIPILAPETGYDLSDLPRETRWVVKVGEPNIIGLDEPTLSGPAYKFYSLDSLNSLVPRFTDKFTLASSCGQPENQDWACEGLAEISFEKQAPGGARIDVIFEVTQIASSSELEFTLGDSRLTGTLPSGIISLTLDFKNSSPSNTLQIRSATNELIEGSKSERFIRVVSVIVTN